MGKKKDANFSLYSHRYESGNIIKKLNIVDDKLAEKKCINTKKRREVERWRAKETAKGNLIERRSKRGGE